MKLFWKIFFTTMILSVSFLSIGSFIIINSGFKYSLEREISSAYTENDILRYSLSEEFLDINKASLYLSHERIGKDELTKEDLLRGVASSVVVHGSDGEFFFRISNKDMKIIYDNFYKKIDNKVISELIEDKKGYQIIHVNDNYYVHTLVPFFVDENRFYIENFRDVSQVFENRNSQYKTYIYIITVMLVIGAIVMVITSWLLTKPIHKLSKATKQIAKGNFGERIFVNSYEEIEELSNNFNLMASNIDHMVAELKEANLRQERFMGSFSHEIKTPLTSMIGYADMLRSKKMAQDQVILSANYIFEEGKRIEALSTKLLNLIILKRKDIDKKTISSRIFFDDIKGIIYPVFERENIEFIVSVEDSPLEIEPDLMKTVCLNLLDNARKAVYDTKGKVVLEGKKTDNGYLISIRDNGKGMAPEELSKITEAFYMVDKSRARIQGGAGLGLTICSEVIKLHNAVMTFESKLNEGTCVTIKLKEVDGV